MGQLTNLYVSSSYQGLLKMTNSTTGVTTSLQTVQTGDGTNTPLQISQTEVNISGSLTVNGAPISIDTGSLVTTASFNAYTSSVNTHLAGLDVETGSLQNQINNLTSQTSSYVTETESGSFVTSVTGLTDTITITKGNGSSNSITINNVQSSSFANNATSASFAQNALSASYAPDNSNRNGLITTGSISGTQSITGSLNMSGSQHTIVGNTLITGALKVSSSAQYDIEVTGAVVITRPTGASGNTSLLVTSSLGASTILPQNITSRNGNNSTGTLGTLGGYYIGNTSLSTSDELGLTIQPATVGVSGGTGNVIYSNDPTDSYPAMINFQNKATWTDGRISLLRNTDITGSLKVTGNISATSASFQYVNTVYETASIIYSSGSNQLGDASNDTQSLYGTVNMPSGSLTVSGVGTSSPVIQVNKQLGNYNPDISVGNYNAGNGFSLSQFDNGTNFAGAGMQMAAQESPFIDMYVNQGNYDSYHIEMGPNTPGGLDSGVWFSDYDGSQYQPFMNVGTLSGKISLKRNTEVTGALRVTNGITGSLQGTASFATNAVSSSQSQNSVSSSYSTNALSASFASNIDKTGLITTGSVGGTQTITGSVIMTGPLNVTGSASVSGTLNISLGTTSAGGVSLGGSVSNKLFVSGSGNDVYLRGTNDMYISPGADNRLRFISIGGNSISASLFGNFEQTGSLSVKSGSLSTISQGTTLNINSYLTSSDPGQSNQIKGWGDNPAAAGAGATQANYTGSLRITGSNNVVSIPLVRATLVGGGTDQQGYVSGSDNLILTNFGGIYLNTGSLLFPKTQNNIIGNASSILMNFTTSSLSGGHPIITNNIVMGGNLSINSNSGSVQTVGQNMVLGGQIASTQNFVTNIRPNITGNNVIGNITLNHVSSSINYQQNYNNSPLTVTNALSSSITQNQLGVLNNIILGGSVGNGHSIFVSGSQNSNVTRYVADNIIGGRNNVVSSSFVSSSASNLFSSIVYGNGLQVSGSHSGNGGSAFVGRFNDTGSLALAQDIVFAVGTGTGTSTRRTGLYVSSGSLVGISGSLLVSGSSTFNGDTIMSSSSTVPLIVSGTINTQRLHFNSNPFNSNPSSNLGAIRMAGDNQTFQYTNYDTAQITTQSFIDQFVDTGSLTTYTRIGASYAGTQVQVQTNNNNGVRNVDIKSDSTTITGSLSVSGSVTIQSGSGDLYVHGHKQFNVGGFQTNISQSGSAAVSQSVSFEVTDVSYGVSMVSGSRITFANAGVYSTTFSAQLDCTAGSDNIWMWLKKNGTNVAESATKMALSNNDTRVMTVNFINEVAANDYLELAWQTTNGNGILVAANASGNIPAIPSVIITSTQVR